MKNTLEWIEETITAWKAGLYTDEETFTWVEQAIADYRVCEKEGPRDD